MHLLVYQKILINKNAQYKHKNNWHAVFRVSVVLSCIINYDNCICCRHLQAMPLRNLKLLTGAPSIPFVEYRTGEPVVIQLKCYFFLL
jgi:hypothetical protein